MKWIIVLILSMVYLLLYFMIQWIYKKEDRMVWCNDYDVIESLQGERRLEYIKISKRMSIELIGILMIMNLTSLILHYSIVITLTIVFCVWAIYRDLKLRKKYMS